MKVWIVCEHPEGWGIPTNMADAICGVFTTKEAAEECICEYMRQFQSNEGWQLFYKDGIVRNEDDDIHYQLIEREIGIVLPYPIHYPDENM